MRCGFASDKTARRAALRLKNTEPAPKNGSTKRSYEYLSKTGRNSSRLRHLLPAHLNQSLCNSTSPETLSESVQTVGSILEETYSNSTIAVIHQSVAAGKNASRKANPSHADAQTRPVSWPSAGAPWTI